MDTSPAAVAALVGIFLLAGGVKGLIGIGLPTVALALLVNIMPLHDAAALMVLPAVLTNIWQASVGSYGLALLRRLWPLLLLLCLTTWIGVSILVATDERLMSGIFGLALAAYALFGLIRPQPRPPGRAEIWLTPLVGLANGIVNGMTGTYAFPGVLYLEALQLRRDEFIQAMGILFLTASTALAVALAGHGVISRTHALLSSVALVPALLGYYAGQHWRRSLSEQLFRKVFLAGLLLLGLYLAVAKLAL